MQSFHDTMTAFADKMHPVAGSRPTLPAQASPTAVAAVAAPRSADMGMAPRTMPMAPTLPTQASPNAFAALANRGGGRPTIRPTRGLL